MILLSIYFEGYLHLMMIPKYYLFLLCAINYNLKGGKKSPMFQTSTKYLLSVGIKLKLVGNP